MKRYHVLGITLLAGIILGLSINAHAEEFQLRAMTKEGQAVNIGSMGCAQGECGLELHPAGQPSNSMTFTPLKEGEWQVKEGIRMFVTLWKPNKIDDVEIIKTVEMENSEQIIIGVKLSTDHQYHSMFAVKVK